jgi:hypothetical protein
MLIPLIRFDSSKRRGPLQVTIGVGDVIRGTSVFHIHISMFVAMLDVGLFTRLQAGTRAFRR